MAAIPFLALLVGYLWVLYYEPSIVCHKACIKMSPRLYDLEAEVSLIMGDTPTNTLESEQNGRDFAHLQMHFLKWRLLYSEQNYI